MLGLVPLLLAATPVAADADTTYGETAGGVAHTWTNYTNAGGTQGASIAANQTVQVTCVVQGFKVADGNTNWYQVASSPWNNVYYVSADAFYNNGATSGSLRGTPFVDPRVPGCGSLPTGYSETVGGPAHTWTNYTNAGGTEGPTIAAYQTVLISCRLTGFKVADGNTWWYRIASAPWSNNYYVSADAFYNNGATSGSLRGTPFVDQAVPVCAGSSNTPGAGTKPTPNAALAKGAAAPAGYRYAISLTGFNPDVPVSITCYDSVSPQGFYTFSLKTNGSGAASTASYCYSGDGPDHWVVAGGVASNHVTWGSSSGVSNGGGATPPPVATNSSHPPTTPIPMPAFSYSAPHHANSKVDGSLKSLTLLAAFKGLIGSCYAKEWDECFLSGKHYLDKTGTDEWIPMSDLLSGQPGIAATLAKELRSFIAARVAASKPSSAIKFDIYPSSGEWIGVRPTLISDWFFTVGHFNATIRGDIWFGPEDHGDRQIQIRYRMFLQDTYNFDPGWEHYGAFEALVDQGRASDFRIFGETKTITITTTLKKINPATVPLNW